MATYTFEQRGMIPAKSKGQLEEEAAQSLHPGKSLGEIDALLASQASGINTSQPSPQTVTATPLTQPQTVPDMIKNQAISSPAFSPSAPPGSVQAASAKQASDLAKYFPELYKKYNAIYQGGAPKGMDVSKPSDARQAVQQSGVDYQTNQGTQYQPSPQVSTAIQETTNPYIQAMSKYFSPDSQRTSLQDSYNKLMSDKGVPALQAELLNDKRIMSGTEDDIRSEITKAGGFATESQVQGMVVARNKNLLKNAQFIQDQLTTAQDQINTQMQFAQQDRQYALDQSKTMFDVFTKGLDYQQQMYTNAVNNDKFNIGQIGYVQYASSLDDTGKKLAGQRLFGDPTVFFDNNRLSQLDTYKDRAAQTAAAKTNIYVQNAGSLLASRDALTAQRYSSTIKSVINTYYPTNKSPIQLYNSSSQVINRTDEAYKLASDPNNKDKAAPDLDLVDAYVSIARGGQQINEAQVDTLLGGLGIKASFDVKLQKITGTGILDSGTRKSLYTLSHKIYDGQAKLANEAVSKINTRLDQMGIPEPYMINDPIEAGSIQNEGQDQYSSFRQSLLPGEVLINREGKIGAVMPDEILPGDTQL